MNCYEHTLITKQDLPESQSKKLIEKYENIIKKNSGKVIKTEEWGLRTLSHKIKNNKKGFYFHIKFEGIGKTIEELVTNGETKGLKYISILEEGSYFFPFLSDLYYYEERYPYMEKIFDSGEINYKEFKIKVFEINYQKFHDLNN